MKKDAIGVKVGRVLNKYKVGKHFTLTIEDNLFTWERRQEAIAQETERDGIDVIRTSEPSESMSAEDAVRGYKRLGDVERAFRSLKGLELLLRPIHHRLDDRVKAHIFVCLLASYVPWHLKQAWAPLLFADEHLNEHRAKRDPVASAQPHAEVRAKKSLRQTKAGLAIQSFRSLMDELGTQCRNDCQLGEGNITFRIKKLTEPTPLQTEATRLLNQYRSQHV